MKKASKFFGIIALAVVIMFSAAIPAVAQGGNMDRLISDFDKAVGDLMALAQKASAGDMAAIMELSQGNLINRITTMAAQLEAARASGQLTPAQVTRLEQIVKKYESVKF